MADAFGEILLKIGADISGLDSRLKKIESSVEATQKKVGGLAGAWDRVNSSVGGVDKTIRRMAMNTASFLGIAWGIHGAFGMIEKAANAWVSTMRQGLTIVDEYRMGIISTAGQMAQLSKVEPRDLGAAYEQWKTYFDWLYRASLEADRLVAASGQEIFEAGKELALRGMVPNNKDQVAITGYLVDFIKSVTKGLSPQQQLWQEVRSMFEGQMRLGAQALQRFQTIDPKFKENWEAARQAAIRLGDAQPLWDLMEKTLAGMKMSSQDLQQTLNSLANTSKSAFGLMMLESFSGAYDALVKYGWSVLDVYYKNGQLTAQGEMVSAALRNAWTQAQPHVEQFVNYLQNNGPEVAATVGRIATAITNITMAAAQATGAVGNLIIALSNINVGNLMIAAGILGAATGAGTLMGAPWAGAAVGVMGAGAYLAHAGKENEANNAVDATLKAAGMTRQEFSRSMDDLRRGGIASDTADRPIEGTGKDWTYKTKVLADDIKQFGGDYGAKVLKDMQKAREAGTKGITLRHEGQAAPSSAAVLAIEREKMAKETNPAKKALMRIALDDAEKAVTDIPHKAPPHPKSGIQAGKEKKEKGGGGGREHKPVDYQLALQEAKARRALAMAILEAERDQLKAETAMKEEALQRDLTNGLTSYEEYYAKRLELFDQSHAKEMQISQEKLKAEEAAYKENIEAIKLKSLRREYTPGEEASALVVEELRHKKEVVKLQGAIKVLEVTGAKERLSILEEQYQAMKKQAEALRGMELDLAWGPLEERKAAIEKIKIDMDNQRKSLGITAGSPMDDRFKKIEQEKIFQAKYKEMIDGAVDVIADGFSSMIKGLMDGTSTLQEAAYDIFSDLFDEALKPGIEFLKQTLTDAFKQLFSEVGGGMASAIMGVIGIIGMAAFKKTGGSFSASGVSSGVTTHTAVRGQIAGETSVPIAEISVSIKEAFLQSERYLQEIAFNTRALLTTSPGSAGSAGAAGKGMEKYVADSLQRGVL